MEWIIKLTEISNQRIKITFLPTEELVRIEGEYKPHNQNWVVFSRLSYNMVMTLKELTKHMEDVVNKMRTRIKEYENFNNGFKVLKEVAFVEDDDN